MKAGSLKCGIELIILKLLRAKINLHEGNITEEEYNDLLG